MESGAALIQCLADRIGATSCFHSVFFTHPGFDRLFGMEPAESGGLTQAKNRANIAALPKVTARVAGIDGCTQQTQ